jgi:hypothetical protein
MNTLKQSEEILVPVNQPTDFPTFHLIPDTGPVRRKRRACNQPSYHQQRTPTHNQKQDKNPLGFIARQKEKVRQAITTVWEKLKAFGRAIVRWLAWKVFLPLSIACALSSQFANPSNLPL